MAKTLTPASDTRTRILDAAESLIAGNGFRNVSLRQITGAAEVNIAAVNYHFGSREGLIGQVLARVIRPINQQRLHLLDLAEERHRGPVPLEEILEALHRPVVAEMQKSPHQTPVYLRLAGRCLSEPPEHFSETLVELFREVIARFMAATKASLPHLDGASIFWRMHFSVGTMIYALTHEDRLPLFSDGIVEATDPEDTLRRLIEFTAAGLRAWPADALLLDAHAPGVYGGTGHTIDWTHAAAIVKALAPLPVILSGGLTPDNITAAVQQTHPSAVDTASGVELAPGQKDPSKVDAFIKGTNPGPPLTAS